MEQTSHAYNERYAGAHLDRIALPMGEIGAGMICLEGTGALSHVSLRHTPDVFNEPLMFSWDMSEKDWRSSEPAATATMDAGATRSMRSNADIGMPGQ